MGVIYGREGGKRKEEREKRDGQTETDRKREEGKERRKEGWTDDEQRSTNAHTHAEKSNKHKFVMLCYEKNRLGPDLHVNFCQ